MFSKNKATQQQQNQQHQQKQSIILPFNYHFGSDEGPSKIKATKVDPKMVNVHEDGGKYIKVFDPSDFKLGKDEDPSKINYVSMNRQKGKYSFPIDDLLFEYIVYSEEANKYCFSPRSTPYFLFQWDFDVDDKQKNDGSDNMLDFFIKNRINRVIIAE